MRHGASGRRSRNRGGNRRGNNNRSQVFDSNGPDVRIRGTAHQIHEKYVALANDATGSGDRILAESYLQHAEHYLRVINSWNEEQEKRQNTKVESSVDDNVGNSKPLQQRKPVEKKPDVKAKEEDLGLPDSIVGKKQDNLEDA